ncbi:MAG: hypothetical protein FWE70_00515 [Oscillospiraceae bacterium]|nr:hypothetical protein [Oscillospiraceae bacterium]
MATGGSPDREARERHIRDAVYGVGLRKSVKSAYYSFGYDARLAIHAPMYAAGLLASAFLALTGALFVISSVILFCNAVGLRAFAALESFAVADTGEGLIGAVGFMVAGLMLGFLTLGLYRTILRVMAGNALKALKRSANKGGVDDRKW